LVGVASVLRGAASLSARIYYLRRNRSAPALKLAALIVQERAVDLFRVEIDVLHA